jgi:hypothetical protein
MPDPSFFTFARLSPEPLLDPPGVRSISHGLCVPRGSVEFAGATQVEELGEIETPIRFEADAAAAVARGYRSRSRHWSRPRSVVAHLQDAPRPC